MLIPRRRGRHRGRGRARHRGQRSSRSAGAHRVDARFERGKREAVSAVAAAVRDRIALLQRLRAAGPGLVTALAVLTLAGSLTPAAGAVAFAVLIARVVGAEPSDLLRVAAVPLVLFAAVQLAGYALGAIREPLSFLAEARIDGAHRAEVARLAATSHTIERLERADVQALIREARADPESWTERTPGQGALTQLGLIGRAVVLISSGAVVAAYAWWMIPLLILPAVAFHQLNWRAGIRWYGTWRSGMGEGMRAEVWQEAISSPGQGKEVRIFGLGDFAVGRIVHHARAMFDPLWTLGARLLVGQWRQFVLVLVPVTTAFLVVASAGTRGGIPVGVAAAVFAASISIYQAFGGDPRATIGAIASMTAFERLRAELGATAPARSDRPAPAADRAGRHQAAPLVRFEDISFSYPGTGHRVLDGLTLEVRPGELLGVVGLNGAGKSTLIKLLARLYDPTSGRVTADGEDLAGIDPRHWRRRISIVFQDFVRYQLSAADNVALGNGAVPRDDAAIEAAARDAGLDGVLAGLPQGWDTPLARSRTGGVDLSGGQWQQVVLARALYAVRTGARLLVLDEPTAHLDVRTEFDVFGRLAARKGDAGVVLISHRLSTVRQADRIVLLSGGRITETGTHAELMALGGEYAAMFALQAERFNRGYDDRIEEGELL